MIVKLNILWCFALLLSFYTGGEIKHSPASFGSLDQALYSNRSDTVKTGKATSAGSLRAGKKGSNSVSEKDLEKVYREIVISGTAFIAADNAALYGAKQLRNPIKVLQKYDRVHRIDAEGDWVQVRTTDDHTGWIPEADLSGLWVYVSKQKRVVTLLDRLDPIVSFNADFSIFISGDKVKRGTSETPEDWRTPEGLFYVAHKKANSSYHKALLINYPSVKHATKAIQEDRISDKQFSRILRSYRRIEAPPMNTSLGGLIEIHGDGTNGQLNWTKGCVAIENHEIDFIFDRVSEGTPVWIESQKKIRIKSTPN